ncbi:hypothetical protein INR49_006199 [Caranx melampygus]|nr:hypothetical protein INR49_006199 [Caranx melampygus]
MVMKSATDDLYRQTSELPNPIVLTDHRTTLSSGFRGVNGIDLLVACVNTKASGLRRDGPVSEVLRSDKYCSPPPPSFAFTLPLYSQPSPTPHPKIGQISSIVFRLPSVQLDMEGALTARDRVGIQDFVLLDETTETAFLSNLKKRFSKDLIYTYIGTLLVSVNPYKELDIYNKKQMDVYMGVNFFELPPHIYALADNAYHTMLTEFSNHFILISGESGAGKTEASKKILQYYAVSCPSTTLLNTVRDKMLKSNPVLEAFGNAKTLKNDNSSRFGKYMDIQFDSQGDAVGGHILNYLLEKSRVVHQNHGERNFHIFYQLVQGGEDELLRRLGLERDCQHYKYLTQHLFEIVASVLHLGNIQFDSDSKGHALLNNNAELHWVSNLLGVDAHSLQEGLTYRKIEAKKDQVLSPFTIDHAIYARDALAKAIYGHTFTWLVNRINASMENKDSSRKTVVGLLDIYGFEVFYVNSFEQFCINYCNEKLQQLFIQLTLKAEQEEYEAEDIEDEECLRPGDATDLTFLERLEEKMGNHPHFVTYKPLCPATWPHWRGVPADGVEVLVQHLGYLPTEYKMGRH